MGDNNTTPVFMVKIVIKYLTVLGECGESVEYGKNHVRHVLSFPRLIGDFVGEIY